MKILELENPDKIKDIGPPAVSIRRRGGQPPASAEIREMGKLEKIGN